MVERYDRPLPLQAAAPRLGANKRPEFEHMLACKMSSESGTLNGILSWSQSEIWVANSLRYPRGTPHLATTTCLVFGQESCDSAPFVECEYHLVPPRLRKD